MGFNWTSEPTHEFYFVRIHCVIGFHLHHGTRTNFSWVGSLPLMGFNWPSEPTHDLNFCVRAHGTIGFQQENGTRTLAHRFHLTFGFHGSVGNL
jgi:hypothetical protein